MENYSPNLDAAFHALADPTRRSVITRLIGGSASVTELAEPFPLGLPTFLKHLKVLEDSGLITTEKVGRTRTCTVKPERIVEVESWLSSHRRLWEQRLDNFTVYVEKLAQSENSND